MYPIKLASNEISGGRLRTAEFGDILVRRGRGIVSLGLLMTDAQVANVQALINRSHPDSPIFCGEICYAAWNDQAAAVRALLKNDPRLARSKDGRGDTVLYHIVGGTNDVALAESVLAAGANIMAKNDNGDTPLDSATSNDISAW